MQHDQTFESPYMTVNEAADYMRVSVSCLRNWIYRRYIPFIREGRVIRLRKDVIDRWFAERCKKEGNDSVSDHERKDET